MSKMTKLQVPMKLSVYQGLSDRADKLGFDSIQAYVRFWATAESTQRGIFSSYLDLSKPEVQALRHLELILATSYKPMSSVQDCLNYIFRQIAALRAQKDLKELTKSLDSYH